MQLKINKFEMSIRQVFAFHELTLSMDFIRDNRKNFSTVLSKKETNVQLQPLRNHIQF